jgi:hypothetical protein
MTNQLNFEETVMWQRLSNGEANYYTKAAEPEREAFRSWLKGLLLEGKVTVEFEKADGTIRAMICTLDGENGAKYAVNESTEPIAVENTKPPKVNNDVQKVWDCQAGAWRSFRWDRLKRIDFSIG